jgi:RND family efflux transporter MFP subunit
MAFQIGGRLTRRLVETGTRVKAGDLLATLDDTDVANELKAAEAELRAAASLEEQAKLADARAVTLLTSKAISKADAEAAQASHRSAAARREAAQTAVDMARRKTGYASLHARQDGVVTQTGANAGQVVAAGQMVVTVASLDEREAVFNVPETVINLQEPVGIPVEVSLVSDPAVRTLGTVREVSPIADATTRTFRVKVSLPHAPETMALGVSVRGKAQLPPTPLIHLPASSLTSEDGKPAVYLLPEGGNALVRRPVEVARYSKDTVFVTGGLTTGERVVTAGVSKLRPGQIVKLEEAGQ